jgi:hypothetical protein
MRRTALPSKAHATYRPVAASQRREYEALPLPVTYARAIVRNMSYAFLSDPWFDAVEALVAEAGDLQIPAAMKDLEINVTVTTASGKIPIFMKDGMFQRGHQVGVTTSLTLGEVVARKIFVEGEVSAGIQAFLSGEIQVEGDLAKVVAMQTVEPSKPQQELTRRVAAITAP